MPTTPGIRAASHGSWVRSWACRSSCMPFRSPGRRRVLPSCWLPWGFWLPGSSPGSERCPSTRDCRWRDTMWRWSTGSCPSASGAASCGQPSSSPGFPEGDEANNHQPKPAVTTARYPWGVSLQPPHGTLGVPPFNHRTGNYSGKEFRKRGISGLSGASSCARRPDRRASSKQPVSA